MVYQSISQCGEDARPDLYGNIVPAGGSAKLRGFADRLSREVAARAPPAMEAKVRVVVAAADPQLSTWLGGSVWAASDLADPMWITKREYGTSLDDHSIIHRRRVGYDLSASDDNNNSK